MLSDTIRILNFDDSVTRQRTLFSRYKAEIIDLEYLGLASRYWINKKTIKKIQERLRFSSVNSVSFLGSGDFHPLSEILLSPFQEAFCLISIARHPDWDAFSPNISCGSWVNSALKHKNILKCVLLGMAGHDLDDFEIQPANISRIKKGRVELYPYEHAPSRILFGKINWTELKNRNLEEFILNILNRLPVKKVYLSIDKDCLKNDFALTNW